MVNIEVVVSPNNASIIMNPINYIDIDLFDPEVACRVRLLCLLEEMWRKLWSSSSLKLTPKLIEIKVRLKLSVSANVGNK